MIEQSSTTSEIASTTDESPTWFEVYAYWQSLGVPQVEVVDFNPSLHDNDVAWFERLRPVEERRGLFYRLQKPPLVGTAFAVAQRISRHGPSLFAAFAIFTTLRQLDDRTPLRYLALEQIERITPDIQHAWHTNALTLLPCDVEADRSFRKDKSWRPRVSLAAHVWSEIAMQYQIVRQPRWT